MPMQLARLNWFLQRFCFRLSGIGAVALFVCSCGVNTDQPVYPLLTFTSVAPPTIVSVKPFRQLVFFESPEPEYKIEFDIEYYVTNQENEFLGYNLYISSTSTSPEAPVTGPYLPVGYDPSFPHLKQEVNTTTLITQRISHFKPPPGERPFDLCEMYYFRLRAYTRNDVESEPSPQIAVCAVEDVLLCPTGTVCNP